MAGDMPRRDFVKVAVAAVVAGPALAAACGSGSGLGKRAKSSSSTSSHSSQSRSSSSSTPQSSNGEPNVYRRSTRHVRNPCAACVAHARNRYYRTAEAAAADPAHQGCRCEVRGQSIADDDVASMFSGSGSATVYDKRSG